MAAVCSGSYACNSCTGKKNKSQDMEVAGEQADITRTGKTGGRQSELKNEKMRSYEFLRDMYIDGYFPNHLVDKCKDVLVDLCMEIEEKNPQTLDELYVLTHATTDRFNDMQQEFYENNSEIETAAREAIGMDIYNIAEAYGFGNADVEELIATRDW